MSLDPMHTNEQKALHDLASQLIADCPDMREMARHVAQQVLERNGLRSLDPDKVFLHRFKRAVSSPRTFNGWQHFETPYQSLTLPQLVMHRFNVSEQDNTDLLGYLVGFYSDGPDKGVYDEHNEVRLDARQVMDYFWSIDFAADFNKHLSAFWSGQSTQFRTLAKANFLSKVLEVCAHDPGSALARCCGEVSQALVGGQFWPPTQEQLQQEVAPSPEIRLCALDIGGHVATDILRVEMQDGRQLLYLPGEVDALQLFPDSNELFWWVLNHNNQAENRVRFMGHFSLADREEGDSNVGLNHLVDLLYQGWGRSDYSGLNTLNLTIQGDAFSWLRDKAHQRMLDDAYFSLRANSDLRKQMWIGYLKAFAQVFGPMAAVDWPVALAVVGAGLAETGLNIDQAINGHTTRDRKAGVTGAIFAAINTLFNATFLRGAPGKPLAELGESAEAAEAGSIEEDAASAEQGETQAQEEDRAIEADDLHAWVPRPFWPGESWELLAPFETNVLLTGEPGSGVLEGVYTQDGQFYVLVDELPYQVRYVNELKTWTIVDPENPFSFYKSQGIRLAADGQWYPLERLGLNGGGLSRLKVWGRTGNGASLPALPETPYEVPANQRPLLRAVTDLELTGDRLDITNPQRNTAIQHFLELREQLAADAARFMQAPELPPRPRIPEPVANSTPKDLFRQIYDNTNGLVVGEAHSGIGSKRLLIDNMSLLRKLKVKTLYMEHYQIDFQQADLDIFNRTGQMSPDLDTYVSSQDRGHFTDPSGRYTFRQVLVAAQKNGVRIQSIDCMASYRQQWSTAPSKVARQQMMNFYAHRIIQADQAVRGPGRWVALVGNTHASTFEGVAGLAETEGAVGLRVEDVPVGQPDSFDTDPGLDISDGQVLRVKSDLRLRAAVDSSRPATKDFDTLLPRPGDYTLEHEGGNSVVVSRGRDMTLRRTLIKREGRYIYIERPEWGSLHERRLPQLADLHTFLALRGMHYIGT
ncbi:membrane-targeted effector domain-containing toxin [Pseudomonas sp. TWI923]|uniref:membrane-targeted effector domain-containing toxin n=1 Tax=Pseudomonas sp. TWI923 TaxID=3136794 RepID=UPI003209526C